MSADDIKMAFTIFSSIFESTRTGTDQKILDFYYDCVNTDECNMSVHQLIESYKEIYPCKKPLSDNTIRQYLNRLYQLNYVEIRTNPSDKRSNLYFPLIKEREDV